MASNSHTPKSKISALLGRSVSGALRAHKAAVSNSGLFDAEWYIEMYRDVPGVIEDPLHDYVTAGWKAGRSPGPAFDGPWYLSTNADVAAANTDPARHFIEHGKREGRESKPHEPVRDAQSLEALRAHKAAVSNSGLFDAEWYIEMYRDVPGVIEDPLHDYVTAGWKAGRSPGPAFDGPWYLSTNADVAAANTDPAQHFIEYGQQEGREPKPPASSLKHNSLTIVMMSGLFDPDWYRTTYGSVIGHAEPIVHYLETGWKQGFWPGPLFDGPGYLEANPDVHQAGMEPLEHFIRYGAREGRRAIVFEANFPQFEPALPAETQALILDFVPDDGGAKSLKALEADPRIAFMAKAGADRDVIDIGFRGTESFDRLIGNLNAGARSARILTDKRPVHATERLKRAARRLGAVELVDTFLARYPIGAGNDVWQPIWTEKVGQNWMVQSHFYERDLKNKLGRVDLIIALSSAFHAFELLHFLERLAYLTDEAVIFDIPIVQPFSIDIDGETVTFKSDDIWSAGDMDDRQTSAMAEYWKSLGISLRQFEKCGGHMTQQQAAKAQVTDVWWWFLGLDGLRQILEIAGLEIVDHIDFWEGRMIGVLARKRGAGSRRADGKRCDE